MKYNFVIQKTHLFALLLILEIICYDRRNYAWWSGMIGVIWILTDSGFLHFLQSPPPPIRLFFGLRWVTATLDIHGTGSRKVSTLNQSHVQRLIAGEVKWFGHSCISPGRRYAGTIRMWHTPGQLYYWSSQKNHTLWATELSFHGTRSGLTDSRDNV